MEKMNKIKGFLKRNKRSIIIGGIVIGIVATAIVLKRNGLFETQPLQWDAEGMKFIAWKENLQTGFMTKDRVIEVLEANANNEVPFAIYREGPNPNEYVTIILGENFVMP